MDTANCCGARYPGVVLIEAVGGFTQLAHEVVDDGLHKPQVVGAADAPESEVIGVLHF